MKRYPVVFTPEANEELWNILGYIAQDSFDAADKVHAKIDKFCYETLPHMPEIGKRRDDVQEGLRFFPVFSTYLVFYSFDGQIITIEGVIHSSQDYKNTF